MVMNIARGMRRLLRSCFALPARAGSARGAAGGRRWSGCGLLLALLVGCNDYNHYDIQLVPHDDAVQRRLTCWRVRPGNEQFFALSDDELAAIGRVYPEQKTQLGAAQQVFSGRFQTRMPADVGGAGSYTRVPSRLGATGIYLERFRGSDDLDARLYDKRDAADRLTDHVLRWFESQMADDRHWPALRQLLHQDFRQDVRNVALYWWTAQLQQAEDGQLPPTLWARLVQYALERDYLRLDEWPRLAHLLAEDNPRLRLGLVRDVLARKLGLADAAEVRQALGFLDDPDGVQQSWEAYLRKTPEYVRLRRYWQQRQPGDQEEPNPWDVLSTTVLGEVVEVEALLRRPDRLTLELKCPRPPLETNGRWSEVEQSINWDEKLPPAAPLPTICYATWCEPDTDFQAAHFGGVVVDGDELAQYVGWEQSLSESDRRDWQAHLETIQPQDDVPARLAEFAFRPRSEPDLSNPSADMPRGLIVGGWNRLQRSAAPAGPRRAAPLPGAGGDRDPRPGR